MGNPIQREDLESTITVTDGQTVSAAVSCAGLAFGSLETPSTFEATSLTFQKTIDGSTFVAAHDSDGTALSIGTVTTSKSYRLPDQLFPCRAFKIVMNSGASGADRTCKVYFEG